jgi:hypothetical protein
MGANVKIHISENKIQTKINYTWENGLGTLSNEILNDCNQYCKEDTGMLIASSYIHSKLDEGKLIWNTPYARRQYYKIRTAHTDVNPQARWKWAHFAKSVHMRDWVRQAQKIMEMMK